MKATGIIRRIDDLGRVVIPNEIRRNLKIREGDPMELYLVQGGVVFKKYSTNLLNEARSFIEIIEDRYDAENQGEVLKTLRSALQMMKEGWDE